MSILKKCTKNKDSGSKKSYSVSVTIHLLKGALSYEYKYTSFRRNMQETYRSWYVCEKLVDTFIRKGFYTVGAMKTNRILYPYGVKMNVCDFAGKLVEAECKELFHLVTVKQRQYYVYRYEGNLNGIENAVVLFTYPKKAFGKEKYLRAFISTNTAISDE